MSARSDRYYALKAAQQCVRCEVKLPDDAASVRCERCAKRARIASTTHARRSRTDRRDRGACAFCGAKSKLYRCPACRIRSNDKSTKSVGSSVDIPAEKQWRTGTTESDAGTMRYRGQGHRGAPPLAVLDEQDLKQVVAEIERCRNALAYARSPQVQELPKQARRQALEAALARADLARRFLGDLFRRHRYEPEDTIDE